jgi:DHA1 family tetracycline resistance protein-like MFS transporter
LLGALAVLAFATLEGTFSLYLRDRFAFTAGDCAFGFAILGLISAMVQGGLIRRLVPRFREPRLILAGLATLTVGMAALAMARTWLPLVGAMVLVGVGQGLYSPTVAGLLSRVTPASEQGAVFGTLSSAQTLCRMISYSAANMLLARAGAAAPYWAGTAIAGVAWVVAVLAVGPMLAAGAGWEGLDAFSTEAAVPRPSGSGSPRSR